MPSNADVIEKFDKELVKYMERQGKGALKPMLDRLEDYLPIRSNLKVLPFSAPNIIALLNSHDLLLAIDVTRKKYFWGDALPDYTDFTYKLVGKVYRDERIKLLAVKVEVEKSQYLRELKTLSPEQIVDKSYQTTIYNDFANMLANPSLTSRQIDTLMTYPHILSSLYDEWISGSYVHTNELTNCLNRCIELQDIYLQGNPVCGVDMGEKEIWDSMYQAEECCVALGDEALDEESEEGLEL